MGMHHVRATERAILHSYVEHRGLGPISNKLLWEYLLAAPMNIFSCGRSSHRAGKQRLCHRMGPRFLAFCIFLPDSSRIFGQRLAPATAPATRSHTADPTIYMTRVSRAVIDRLAPRIFLAAMGAQQAREHDAHDVPSGRPLCSHNLGQVTIGFNNNWVELIFHRLD